MLSGQVHLPSMTTTEIGEWGMNLEYSVRTEYVTFVSNIKDMGLPATIKITLGSEVLIFRIGAV